MESWQHFAQWMFYGALGFIAMYVARTMELMRKSIERLNIQIAVIIEKTTHHERRITKIEKKFIA